MPTFDHRLGRLLRRTLQLIALGCGLWSAGCHKFEDCDLYNTCPGALTKMVVAAAGDTGKAGVYCRACLTNQLCDSYDAKCAESEECRTTVSCRLTTDPLSFRRCLKELNENGYTNGMEPRYPWQGEVDDAGAKFLECLPPCAEYCAPPTLRWSCEDQIKVNTYKLRRDNKPFLLQLSIAEYDPDRGPDGGAPADHSKGDGGTDGGTLDPYRIQMRYCRDNGNLEPDCSNTYYSERELIPDVVEVKLDGANEIERHRLYFELTACRSEGSAPDASCTPLPESHPRHFPPTLYYPGVLLADPDPGRDGLRKQPLAIYLIPSALVKRRNSELGWGPSVLKDRAQSLVLPDSCIWEEISAPGVRIQLQERDDLPLCFSSGLAHCKGSDCPPCIWYADGDTRISTERTKTTGAGAGIVGLEAGNYTIVATDSDTDAFIASRKVQMRPGWLTIVHTWPGMRAPD